ncbi:MAG: MltA domain-containing protein, partial [Pseudomonadota bacterium]
IMERKNITMQSLRRWLYDHPNDMWQVLWENPTYIFFREAGDAVVGSSQAALTPMRSLAVDTKYIPLGMPIFINTMFSDNGDSAPVIQRKLMIAQDTGRAIRGPIRADIFFGSGISAEKIAGRLKSGGEFILLVPRSIAGLIKLD